MVKIKNNKIGKIIKLIRVKLYGAKPKTASPPNKSGAKNKTKNLLFNSCVKLFLKSYFQFFAFSNNLYS